MSEPVVQYSVKEVLDRIERKLDDFASGLSSRIDGHEIRLKTLEDAQKYREQLEQNKSDWRRWVIPVLVSVAGTVAMILSLWHH